MQRGPDLKFWSGVGLALVSLAPGISDAIRTILALIGGALIVVSIVFAIVRRPSPAPSPSGPRRTDWEEQFHEHRLDRREFNRLLKAAFANWSMKPTGDRSLEDIARGSQIPTDLPLTDNSKFPHWAWAAEERCTGKCILDKAGESETDAENEKGAPQIEVTPEMIKAGVDAHSKCQASSVEELVATIYRAMRDARLRGDER